MLDTRDLYRRQCELQEELDDLKEAVNDAKEELEELLTTYRSAVDAGYSVTETEEKVREAQEDLADWINEFQEELDELNILEGEIGRNWLHGETLIDEGDFVEYAQDLAEDISGMPRDQPWPFSHIDWEAAADDLRSDYSSVEYQGNTYLYRG